ncbi:MAG TPA: DUF6445 family protein [Magnetospirillaceae bacterium]|nr:DUF6445 family protein [Magnetospirillaceae bacterium]
MNIRPFLHPDIQVKAERIGREGGVVVTIDNFLLDADQMVDYAARGAIFVPAGALYPGMQAPLPAPYPLYAHFFTKALIPEAFGLGKLDVIDCRATFSMMTVPPNKVGIRQRVPHMDMPDPDNIVLLHYLFDDPEGGTAFYRHRATGFEAMNVEKRNIYEEVLKDELAAHPHDEYIRADSPVFEQIARYPAKFNRAILYRSNTLHAAAVSPGFDYSRDPRKGRLTANTVFRYGDAASLFGAYKRPDQ